MSTFKGFVKKINAKSGVGLKGKPWTVYSIKLEREDGVEEEKWISAGFEKPNFKEGDFVAIEAKENDKGYLNVVGYQQLKNPPARSASVSSPAATKGASGHVKATSGTQTSIHYQSARKDAIEVLKLLQSQDALPLSAAKTKAGEAKRFEELMALVDKLTVQFFYDAETHRLLDTVADAGKIDTNVGKLPAGDVDDDSEEDDEDETDDE